MKVYTTVLGVTGITVQPGTTINAGKVCRVIVTSAGGEFVLRLAGETRDDLRVTLERLRSRQARLVPKCFQHCPSGLK